MVSVCLCFHQCCRVFDNIARAIAGGVCVHSMNFDVPSGYIHRWFGLLTFQYICILVCVLEIFVCIFLVFFRKRCLYSQLLNWIFVIFYFMFILLNIISLFCLWLLKASPPYFCIYIRQTEISIFICYFFFLRIFVQVQPHF